MSDFRYKVVPEVFLGPDAVLKLPYALGGLADRAMLVADPILSESNVIDRITALLQDRGINVLLYDELPEFGTSESIEAGVRLARGARAPIIIGSGGLRTLWAAKAIAALAWNGTHLDDWLDGNVPSGPSAPLVLLPTSVRDPFLLTDRLMITDARDRRVRMLSAGNGGASVVIMDPGLSTGMSSKNAAICVLDTIMACVEGSVSSKANFYSDILLERAVGLLARALDVLLQHPDDPQARLDASRGAFLAASGLAASSLGLGSAVTYAINARFRVPKANLATVLLPYVMEAATKSRIERVAALAPAFGISAEEGASLSAAEGAAKAIEAVRTRLGMLKIPSRLKDFDLDLDRMVEVAEIARSLEIVNYMPRIVSVDDVFDLIKTAY